MCQKLLLSLYKDESMTNSINTYNNMGHFVICNEYTLEIENLCK